MCAIYTLESAALKDHLKNSQGTCNIELTNIKKIKMLSKHFIMFSTKTTSCICVLDKSSKTPYEHITFLC